MKTRPWMDVHDICHDLTMFRIKYGVSAKTAEVLYLSDAEYDSILESREYDRRLISKIHEGLHTMFVLHGRTMWRLVSSSEHARKAKDALST